MKLSEYSQFDATGLAEIIRTQQITPAEAADLARRAIDSVNPNLNFVAERIDPIPGSQSGPFAGVPCATKDLSMTIAGVRHYAGSRLFKKHPYVPRVSCPLFQRFQNAGLQTVVTTTTPEFGFNTTTEAIAYGGPTKNPWDITRSAGGSSGGSCVAVASGAVPIAHANDAAGSIRIPASLNGIVGLKPSRGIIPHTSGNIFPVMGLAMDGVVTRSVRDSALMLDQLTGGCTGEFVTVHQACSSYATHVQKCCKPKRIAFATHLPGTPPPSPAMRTAIEATAQTLSEMGHIVEHACPSYDYETWWQGNYIAFYSSIAAEIKNLCDVYKVPATSDYFEEVTLASAEAGEQLSLHDIHRGWSYMHTVCQAMGTFMHNYDALLLPTTRDIAVPLGVLNQNDSSVSSRDWQNTICATHPYTPPFNMTGNPAISIPCGISDGLPLGAQIVGKLGDDLCVLQLAKALEEAQPWAHHKPTVHVSTCDQESQ